jgi:hypothetical protein
MTTRMMQMPLQQSIQSSRAARARAFGPVVISLVRLWDGEPGFADAGARSGPEGPCAAQTAELAVLGQPPSRRMPGYFTRAAA